MFLEVRDVRVVLLQKTELVDALEQTVAGEFVDRVGQGFTAWPAQC